MITLYPALDFVAKSQALDTATEPIKLKAFTLVGTEDLDRIFCPVRALLQYRKAIAPSVIHSSALLHPRMYPNPTIAQPCRVFPKRHPIKPAGKVDNDRSAGHCFLFHVYLPSGDEWIEHFGEQQRRRDQPR